MKVLLAAGIVRDFRFSSAAAYVDYLDRLRSDFRILDSCSCEDGSILVRILSAYNASPLIQLEGGDQDEK